MSFDIHLIFHQYAGRFLFFGFSFLLIEYHEESLVKDRFVQYNDWGSSKSAAPNAPEGWGWSAGKWWGEVRSQGVREHYYLLVDWQTSFHDTNYLQWIVCVRVCMSVELLQVSHPLIFYCRGKLLDRALPTGFSLSIFLFLFLYCHLPSLLPSPRLWVFFLYFSSPHV